MLLLFFRLNSGSFIHIFCNNIIHICTTHTKYVGYLNKGEKGIFQRRYFEHTILPEEELNNQIDYIHYNPIKHNLVNNVKDWEYSSFHKYVKQNLYDINWGSSNDVENIINLDFE